MTNAFDAVAGQYKDKSLVQKNAAGKLMVLLAIKNTDAIIDIACGPGHLTNALAALTRGKVVGTDISSGMIAQAKKAYPAITFREISAEQLDYTDAFDIAFCNSALQWFNPPEKALAGMYRALKNGGVLGIACPGTTAWAPWFLEIIPQVTGRPEISAVFKSWKNPWFFLPTQASYQKFFEAQGFDTRIISVDYERTEYTPEEAYNIYLSGAANGFVGKQCYTVSISDDYINLFNSCVRQEIEKRMNSNGKVAVDFNRLYYVGVKTAEQK